MKVPILLIYPRYLYPVVIYQDIDSEVPQKFLVLSPALTQQRELSNLYTCTLFWASKLKALQTLQLCLHKINLVLIIATENENEVRVKWH